MINKIIKYVINLINKKNNNDMITEEQLISYKQNFTGKQFQWIKTDRPELMGKVVKCRDITPNGMVRFDDGSEIFVKDLNNKLMMIHGEAQPLTKSEVEAISPFKKPKIEQSKMTKPGTSNSTEASPKVSVNDQQSNVKNQANPFEMFNSDETELTIKLNIKLPDKKLLKMMYNNAEDKEEFINHLSDYVNSSIDNSVIKTSLKQTLDPIKKNSKSNTRSSIKITEVTND